MKNNLIPFQNTPYPLAISTESFLNSQNELKIIYFLKGRIDLIQLLGTPPIKKDSHRAHDLWKNTCFEWFLKSSELKKYWEFNASPIGPWNFYSLDDYRKNLQECPEIETLKETQLNMMSEQEVTVEVCVSLNKLMQAHPELLRSHQFAITAVIQWKTHETSYFSLKHPSEKADFHHQDGFILNL